MTYTAGIIGAGGIAGLGILGLHDEEDIGKKKFDASHAGGFHSTDEIELVAVADPDDEKRRTFGDAWDLDEDGLYADHREMLESESLDVVSVCTPTMLHHDHVLDAAEIGDPELVWCEKPIASSVADAKEMVDVCEDEGVELLVNHSFRFTDKIVRIRELLQEERLLGTVRSISVQYRMEMMRNATHVLDSLLYFLDARPETVSGHITGENEAADALQADREVTDAGGGGFVVFDDGTFTTIDCTIPRDISSMNYEIIGTEGKLSLNNDDGEWRYWRLEDGEHVEDSLPGIDEGWQWDPDYKTAFPNAAAHIVDLLEGRATNRSPGDEATRALEMIVGFYVTHYTDSQTTLPLERPLEHVEISSW